MKGIVPKTGSLPPTPKKVGSADVPVQTQDEGPLVRRDELVSGETGKKTSTATFPALVRQLDESVQKLNGASPGAPLDTAKLLDGVAGAALAAAEAVPWQTETLEYNGITFTVPKLSTTGITFEPGAPPQISAEDRATVTASRIDQPWKLSEFGTAHRPLSVGMLTNPSAFASARSPRVLDMPIKFPGAGEFKLPAELEPFREVIQQMIDYETSINPSWKDYYAYLTVDQGFVEAGDTQRRGGLHVEEFQPAQETDIEGNHSYVVSNAVPTVFYDQGFETGHLDPTRHNFFWDFDRQGDESKTWRPQANEIVLLDAYQVHRADTAKEPTRRTFLRVSFSKQVFDRLGMTHNPMIDYQWDMKARQTLEKLERYVPPAG